MAKFHSDFLFSGTIGNLTIYQLGGKSYVRTKSSLDRKRFFKDPAFARSREKAVLFGQAARITKAFYGELPKELRRHGLFGSLTAMAYKGLQKGKCATTITKELEGYCGMTPPGTIKEMVMPVQQKNKQLNTRHLSKWRVDSSGRLHINKDLPLLVWHEKSHQDAKAQRSTKKYKEERRE